MSENAKLAREALLRNKVGSLGVIDFETGGPYVSLANYACDRKGLPVFLFSTLARHTKGIAKDARASLLVAEPAAEGDALTGLRASFMGVLEQASADEVKPAYFRAHPYAAGYADFADFSFYRLYPETVHVVGGFGRIETFKADQVFGRRAEIEDEISRNEKEIAQIESELMSPDSNSEGIREREMELREKNILLRREITALKSD